MATLLTFNGDYHSDFHIHNTIRRSWDVHFSVSLQSIRMIRYPYAKRIGPWRNPILAVASHWWRGP